jgi:hypothetical protein
LREFCLLNSAHFLLAARILLHRNKHAATIAAHV